MKTQTCAIKNQGPGEFSLEGPLNVNTVTTVLKSSRPFFTGVRHMCVDFSAVTQVDSAAVALLIAWMRLAKQQNIQLRFQSLPKQMLELSRVSGVDTLLPTQ